MTLNHKAQQLLLRAGIAAPDGALDLTELADLIGDRDALMRALIQVGDGPCWCRQKTALGHTVACVGAQDALRNAAKRSR